MFVAIGIWACERSVRIMRLFSRGNRTATVTIVPETDGEYIQREVDGKVLKDGVAFLCFPSLSWRFWGTRPFSVSGALNLEQQILPSLSRSTFGDDELETGDKEVHTTVCDPASTSQSPTKTVFFARTRSGVTKQIAQRIGHAHDTALRLRVFVEGPYDHSGHVQSQIAKCDSVLCIAGGVGITACLPILKDNKAKDVKLY